MSIQDDLENALVNSLMEKNEFGEFSKSLNDAIDNLNKENDYELEPKVKDGDEFVDTLYSMDHNQSYPLTYTGEKHDPSTIKHPEEEMNPHPPHLK